MSDLFARSPKNPIITPNLVHDREVLKVYNPGVIYNGEDYHLFYRAMGEDKISSIGYALSQDGEYFQRFNKPLLRDNSFSMEDPRITKVGGRYFMTYTRYDGLFATLNLITSDNLKDWKHHGEMMPAWDAGKAKSFLVNWDPDRVRTEKEIQTKRKWSKSGGIIPEYIHGKYWMLFGDSHVWIASSVDGIHWEPQWEPFISPRSEEYFDNVIVEMGPPPMKTEKGWLVFYHGINSAIQYQIGILLLDLDDPTKILFRSSEPIFSPKMPYELSGGMVDIKVGEKEFAPQVIFVPGAVVLDGIVRLFYGAGDQYICTATALLQDVLAVVS